MKSEEILRMVREGEGQTTEFKASFGQERRAIETLCAFAHADGGTVLYGVLDDGTVRGVSVGKKTLEDLAHQVRTNTEPPLAPKIYRCVVKERDVVAVTVSNLPPNGVCFAYNIPYVRVGKVNQVMHPNQIAERVVAGLQPTAHQGQVQAETKKAVEAGTGAHHFSNEQQIIEWYTGYISRNKEGFMKALSAHPVLAAFGVQSQAQRDGHLVSVEIYPRGKDSIYVPMAFTGYHTYVMTYSESSGIIIFRVDGKKGWGIDDMGNWSQVYPAR